MPTQAGDHWSVHGIKVFLCMTRVDPRVGATLCARTRRLAAPPHAISPHPLHVATALLPMPRVPID
jgi:hypothetical protein